MLINNVPNYKEYRKKLLPLAYDLHNIPRQIQRTYERPEAYYAVGLCPGDRYAYKGIVDVSTSWYCNPLQDKVEPVHYIKDGKEMVGSSYEDNFWPTEHLPELEPAFKNMGKLNSDVGVKLSHHIEKLVKKLVPTY